MTNGRTIFISALVSAIVATIFGGAAGLLFGVGGVQFKNILKPTTATTSVAARGPGLTDSALPQSRVISEDSGVISVVKNVSPSVVSIVISKNVSTTAPFDDPLFRQFFGETPSGGTQKQEVGGGSGFIVSEDGLILTNKHVVSDTEAEYTVLLNDGKSFPAKVLARDPTNDIAILKVDKSGLTPVELGDSSAIQIGQRVVAIGNALGEFRNTVSTGVVSGLSRSISTGSGDPGDPDELRELLQTDAAINPGNSGGPLLDIDGRVIGINTAIVQGAQNIGFALPINSAKEDIESVRKNGKIVRPILGIRYVPVNKALQIQGDLGASYGAYIPASGADGQPTIIPNGPAALSGLRERDIILEVNGLKITEESPLPRIVEKYKPDQTVTLTVLRESKKLTIKLKLGEASY